MEKLQQQKVIIFPIKPKSTCPWFSFDTNPRIRGLISGNNDYNDGIPVSKGECACLSPYNSILLLVNQEDKTNLHCMSASHMHL